MQAVEILHRELPQERLPLHKLLNPNYFLRHPSMYRRTELVSGPQQVVAVGDSIAMGEDDSLSQITTTIGLPAGSVVASAVEQTTQLPCDFVNIAVGGDATKAIRERLPQHTDVFQRGHRTTAIVSAGINTLGQQLFGDPEAFEVIMSLANAVDRDNRSFSPKMFKAPALMYRILNGAYQDVHGLFHDLLRIHDETDAIDQIAVIGSYDFGLMNNLTVDLKTVPETHQEGVRTLAQTNRLIRHVSSFVSRMNNNLLAMAIEQVESQVPAGRRPNFLLLDTFSRLKQEDIDLHPTRKGQLKIAQLVLERMVHEGQSLAAKSIGE